jgi:hypothetical protein
MVLPAPQTPPDFCQYVDDACNQTFLGEPDRPNAFCAYPSDPPQIAETIERACSELNRTSAQYRWKTWRDMTTQGQIIFCEVCKNFRASNVLVADVTTLNFNLLFEIGFAMGLGIPIVLVRDTNYVVDTKEFAQLGILDTIGYEDFRNSQDLIAVLPDKVAQARPMSDVQTRAFREAPIYIVRPHVMTEGSIQLESILKKSRLRYRTHDPDERARLTINEARRQVNGSLAVVATLLPSGREGHRVHNGLCAFVAGYAVAQQKIVVLLQDGTSGSTPIDYRDIVGTFTSTTQISALLQPTLNRVYDVLQSDRFDSPEVEGLGILSQLDLGDPAAENEIGGLKQYFVPTGPATRARQGHARLVVGRKGTGKTAIFYEVRNAEGRGLDRLVLDLKPEGHQFLRLREFVESRMQPGLREYTLTGFWTYILLTEMARKLRDADERVASHDPERFREWSELDAVYSGHDPGDEADFTQRLHRQVNRIVTGLEQLSEDEFGARMTEVIYGGDVRRLRDAVTRYVKHKDSVWLLVDNLDKGWPIQGSTEIDILLIRSLLEATRKLQQWFEDESVEFKCLVFLRSDIYDHLQRETPDKGKDTAIVIEWDDPAIFETIIQRRVMASTDLAGDFRDDIWPAISAPLVGSQDSLSYIIERTLMRPRDLLMFLQRAIDTAINRGDSRVTEEDILFAEARYSNELLANVEAEIVDTNPELEGVVSVFEGAPVALTPEEAEDYLQVYGELGEHGAAQALRKLIWYGFFGVRSPLFADVLYSHSQPDFRRLLAPVENGDAMLIVHPAFRSGLNIQGE